MKRWKLISIVSLVILVALIATSTPYGESHPVQANTSSQGEDTVIVRAYFPSLELARKAVISFEAETLESEYETGYLVMELTQDQIAVLTDLGFQVEVDEQYTFSTMSIPSYPCYRTVEETFATAQAIANNHPNLATWTDVGNSWEKSAGLGGYDMMVLRLTNSAISGPKPKLFITGAIHAREYTTAELATRFAEYLVDNYGTDADATWILDHHEVHLMLQTNPDGRKKAETGLSWRKNTNQNYCGATSNDRGADLNRNFEFQWACCGGSSGNECDSTYRGPNPASEPETQAAQNYMRAQFPDQRAPSLSSPAPDDATGVYIDLHSHGRLVLWPWGFTSNTPPNSAQLQTLGRKFAYWNNHSPEQAIGLYPTDGTTDDFAYGDLGIAAYCFELGTAFFQSCSYFEGTIVPDNMPSLIYAAKVARTPYMTPAGPDAYSLSLSQDNVPAGTPVTLSATVNDTRYNNSNGTEPTQNIAAAEYYVDVPPWESGSTAHSMSASDGSFNEKTEGLEATVDTTGWSEGQHIIFVRGRDTNNNWGAFSAIFLNVTGGATPTPTSTPTDTPTPTPTPTLPPGTILDAHFDTGADGFSYADDTFRGTNQPAYASGTWLSSGGFSGGGLQVLLGGINDNDILDMSGGWQRTFNLSAPTEVTLSFRYKLTQSSEYESDEYSQALVSVDGTLYGSGANDYVAQITGNGNGGSDETTGWQLFEVNLGTLSAGDHTLTIGGYNNKKTYNNETTEVLVDDVLAVGGEPGPTPTPTPTSVPPTPTDTPTPTGVPPTPTPTSTGVPPTPTDTPTPTPTSEPGVVFSDDFESDKGWTVNPGGSDTATTGMWERANPEGTEYSGVTYQLDTTASGSYDLVTGPLAGSGVGSYDIDGGVTSIRSPDIALPGSGSITLSFKYYLSHYNNATSDDFLWVKVVGSTTNTVLEELGSGDYDEAAWADFNTSLDSFAGQTVYLLIEAADGGSGSLVEAAIDDVSITSSEPPPPTPTPTNTPPPTNTPTPTPTPTQGPGPIFSDDFETDKGWTVNPAGTDTATTGMWERANPQGTSYSGVTYQLDTTASGSYDLVTGPLAGSSVGSYDIDGGLTSIRSPDIALPGSGSITLSFKYYLSHYNNATSDDFLRVKVVGSTTSTVLEELGSGDYDEAAWADFNTSLDIFAGQTVYLLIEAADGGSGSLVEAAIDDMLIE